MTNSEKQTKSPKGVSSAPPASAASFRGGLLAKQPTLVVGGVLLIMGWGFALHVNNWHFTVPVFMLWMAWLGALVTVRLLWGIGLAVASEASDSAGMQALDVTEARRIELSEEKKSLIRAIKEIEFDRDLGKMSDEDATEMMRFYRSRAVEVIKELAGSDDGTLSVEERVERDLKARLAVEGAVQRGSMAVAAAKAADKGDSGSAETADNDKATSAQTAAAKVEAPATKAIDTATEEVDDSPAKEPEESSKKITTSASEEPTEAPLESA